MTPKSDPKTVECAERLAQYQLSFAQLVAQVDASSRKNRLVVKCLSRTASYLRSASTNLFQSRLDSANALLDITAIYIIFAKRIVETDQMEEVLGEGDYLELEATEPRADLVFWFDSIAEDIQSLRRSNS